MAIYWIRINPRKIIHTAKGFGFRSLDEIHVYAIKNKFLNC
jgi:hypothetical protein